MQVYNNSLDLVFNCDIDSFGPTKEERRGLTVGEIEAIKMDNAARCWQDAKSIHEYILQNKEQLFDETKAAYNHQKHFSRKASGLPIAFQLALPQKDDIKPEDLNVYLHFKPAMGKRGGIEIGSGNYKVVTLWGRYCLRNPVLKCAATATPKPSFLASILNELKALKELDCEKNILKVLSSVSYRNKVNMVMPLATNDLENELEKGALDSEKRKAWTLQLVRTLIELKEKKWIHDDLKPANVLIVDGAAILTDFGFAWKMTDDPMELGGSILYFSPEKHKFLHLAGQCDAKQTKEAMPDIDLSKSDVFAMGMILYQMKHQKKPIESPTDEANPPFAHWMERAASKKRFNYNVAFYCIKTWNETDKFKPKDKEDEVIYKMLKVDPKERISAEDALFQLQKIYE